MACNIVIAAAANLLLSSVVGATDCVCQAQWSYGSFCVNEQGCPDHACGANPDNVSKTWCYVANPGCKQAHASIVGASDWAYCQGDETKLANAYIGHHDENCKDIAVEADDPQCWHHVTWAMDTGFKYHPHYYVNYTGMLFATSPRIDFQCVLSSQVGPDEAGTGHDCPIPCSSTMKTCTGGKFDSISSTPYTTTSYTAGSYTTSYPTTASTIATPYTTSLPATGTTISTPYTTTTAIADQTDKTINGLSATIAPILVGAAAPTPAPDDSAFPWYAILLITFAVLACVGLVAGLFLCFRRDGKVRRSVDPMEVQRSLDYGAPMPELQTTPLAAYQPIWDGRPYGSRTLVQTSPRTTTTNVERCRNCGTYYVEDENFCRNCGTMRASAEAQANAAFDRLDANHDGVITRAEFNRTMIT